MPDFADFDQRGYRSVDARRGYAQWAPSYDDSVEDAMDLELLERIDTVAWTEVEAALDLGCGTGRTGSWLRAHGVRTIDGVDLTPEMLERAQTRGVYRRLIEGDVRATGLDADAYDLIVTCLVDEHLPTLEPLYAEAGRLASEGGAYVLVGYHPQFIMASGMPTHFDGPDGEPIAIETHLHLLSEHVAAAHAAGWTLAELHEAMIDDAWIERKPTWAALRGQPFTFACAWRHGR